MYNDDWNNNNWNSRNSGRVSEREQLELDENGDNKRNKRNSNNQNDWNSNGYNGGKKGFRNPFKRNKYGGGYKGNSGGGSGGSGKGFVYFIIIFIILFLGSGMGVKQFWRTKDRTAEENMGTLPQAIKKITNEKNKLTQQELRGEEVGLDKVYDTNNLYDDTNIEKQVDKEYLVYVYTGNEELDKPFNEFVLENEGSIPIYRLNRTQITSRTTAIDYVKDKPVFLFYNEATKNYKVLDSAIDEPELFENILPYFENIITNKKESDKLSGGQEKPEYLKSNDGDSNVDTNTE